MMLSLNKPSKTLRSYPPRLLVLAAFACLLVSRTIAAAADHDLTLCLDTGTKLDAGGDVSDKDLSAARQACQRAKHVTQSEEVQRHLNAAAVTVEDESARRHH
jgi:hypothetical protein